MAGCVLNCTIWNAFFQDKKLANLNKLHYAQKLEKRVGFVIEFISISVVFVLLLLKMPIKWRGLL